MMNQKMTRRKKRPYEELIKEIKQQILRDRDIIEKMEERLEKRYESKLEGSSRLVSH